LGACSHPVKAAAKAATPKTTGKVALPAAKGKTAAMAKAPVKPAAPTTVTLKHLSAGLAGRHGMEKKQADAVVADAGTSHQNPVVPRC